MFVFMLLCMTLASDGAQKLSAADRKTYQELAAKAGHDADLQARLALWCESHGLNSERLKHLALALLADPDHGLARGLSGMVSYRGRWEAADKVSERVNADEKLAVALAEYNTRRAKIERLADTDQQIQEQLEGRGRTKEARSFQFWSGRKLAPEHVALGAWCEENGLAAEATAHYTTALTLDPYLDAVWRHLGYVKHSGRWMTRSQIDEEQNEAAEQKRADKYWEPLFRLWKGWFGSKFRRTDAEQQFERVDDPRAVPMIYRFLCFSASAEEQEIAVRTLGRIPGAPATRELAELAVYSVSSDARDAAIEHLKKREPTDYANILIELIHAPVRYDFLPVQGPGTRGALVVDTSRFHILRTYDAPPAFTLGRSFYGYAGYDPNGLPVIIRGVELRKLMSEKLPNFQADLRRLEARTQEMLAAAQLRAQAAQARLVADINDIETFNAISEQLNPRIVAILQATLDAPDHGVDEDSWHRWWYDKVGYRYEPPPKIDVTVNATPDLAPPRITTCFVAGTLVRTLEGDQPIEDLKVGDRVLSQNVTTGSLNFRPILVVHHNPPDETLRIKLAGGETLVSSVYHRYWRPGRGWAMARELRPGEAVRTLRGVVKIDEIQPGQSEPLYNLTVAENRSFFVGRAAALVHDNTQPDSRVEPFDTSVSLAESKSVP
jgi:hypothetical protein